MLYRLFTPNRDSLAMKAAFENLQLMLIKVTKDDDKNTARRYPSPTLFSRPNVVYATHFTSVEDNFYMPIGLLNRSPTIPSALCEVGLMGLGSNSCHQC